MKYRTEAQELAYIHLAMRGAQRTTGVTEPEVLIARAIQKHGSKLVVSWSGGRCSTVVLFMALKVDPNIKAIFNDMGGAEFPETIRFVKEYNGRRDIRILNYFSRWVNKRDYKRKTPKFLDHNSAGLYKRPHEWKELKEAIEGLA